MLFVELAEIYYNTVEFYLDKIAAFTFNLIRCNQERLVLLGMEFWCRLGSEELTRYYYDQQQKSKETNFCKYFFSQYFKELREIVDTFIVKADIQDEDDSWNPSKASCYILVNLVQLINTDSLHVITNEVKGNFII